jgi:pimeloyl-ACP methyl ester carboxylesterase
MSKLQMFSSRTRLRQGGLRYTCYVANDERSEVVNMHDMRDVQITIEAGFLGRVRAHALGYWLGRIGAVMLASAVSCAAPAMQQSAAAPRAASSTPSKASGEEQSGLLPSEQMAAPSRDAQSAIPAAAWPAKTYYRFVEVHGHRIFYREAGDPSRQTVLLLHGYPSSSHTYRELIPLLSGRYHVLAPDYIGSGYSDHPDAAEVKYTFDFIADHVTGFIEALKLDNYVLYLQDFGGPVGFRVALAHPERLRALVVQNANAYLEGLTPDRQAFFRAARDDASPEQRAKLTGIVSDDGIRKRQYLRDVAGEKEARMCPDSWTHDLARLPTPQDRAIQVELFQDYQNNIDAYPRWQEFLRTRRPPTLIVWGEHDPAFIAAGAKAYLRDVPDAELHLLDAGHFAVEEQAVQVAQYMVQFIERLSPKSD